MTERWHFSFGQDHTHRLHLDGFGVTLDCDGILEVVGDQEAAREKVFELIGAKWAFCYPADKHDMKYFPRGVVATITL